LANPIAAVLVPIHRDGYRFIALFGFLTLLAFVILPPLFGWLGVILTLWCAYFFRDPPRVTPLYEGFVIAPADGVISAIETVAPPPELDLPATPVTRISIFMNVFDVHVNRAPADGRIARLAYVAGKFLNASLDKASADNERQALTLEMPSGTRIGVVQIAGLIARRIVAFAGPGDQLRAGQRFGLIRFGSRVDVYLPPGQNAQAIIGQRTVAGETILADLTAARPPLEGLIS
jgi:phosphatidylserine decarboxylase